MMNQAAKIEKNDEYHFDFDDNSSKDVFSDKNIHHNQTYELARDLQVFCYLSNSYMIFEPSFHQIFNVESI